MASLDSSSNLDLSAKSRKRCYARKAALSTSTSLSSISSSSSSSSSVSSLSGGESDLETARKKSRPSLEVQGKSRRKPNLTRQREQKEIASDASEDSGVAQVDVQESRTINLSRPLGRLSDTGVSSDGSDSDECRKKSLDDGGLLQLYENCAKLYVAKKISHVNAFKLELVDYMQEILQLEAFRRRNLVGRVHVVEIGSKIHEGRVDHVGRSITKLAGEVAVNSVSLDPERTEEEAEKEQSSLEIAQKKERNRKKSRFIVDDESKITTRFEDQSIKYSHRRNTLKNLFFKNTEEEVEFEYLSFFVDPAATHPLKKPEELAALRCDAVEWPDEKDELEAPKWIPFTILNKWDPEVHDLWGLPLVPEKDESSLDNDSHMAVLPTCEVFAHDRDRAVNNSPLPSSSHQDYDDSQGVDIHTENTLCNEVSDDPAAQSRPRINIDTVRSLSDLRIIFERWSLQPVPMKIRYGWLGPLFFRSSSTVRKRKGRQRGACAKFINMEAVDFSDPANCYQIAPPEKTQLSTELLLRWRDTNSNLDEFINTREVSSSDDYFEEDPYGFLENDHPTCLETYFTNPNRRFFEGGYEPIVSTSGSEDEMTQGVSDKNLFGQAEMDTECDELLRDDFELTQAILEPMGDCGMNPAFNDHAPQHFDFQEFFPNMHLTAKDPDEGEEIDFPECRLRYCMKPRPVNMHALKKAILEFLQSELHVNEFGEPLKAEETTTNLPRLMQSLKDRLDDRNRENPWTPLVPR